MDVRERALSGILMGFLSSDRAGCTSESAAGVKRRFGGTLREQLGRQTACIGHSESAFLLKYINDGARCFEVVARNPQGIVAMALSIPIGVSKERVDDFLRDAAAHQLRGLDVTEQIPGQGPFDAALHLQLRFVDLDPVKRWGGSQEEE